MPGILYADDGICLSFCDSWHLLLTLWLPSKRECLLSQVNARSSRGTGDDVVIDIFVSLEFVQKQKMQNQNDVNLSLVQENCYGSADHFVNLWVEKTSA